MINYRRILTLVDFDSQAEAVARRGLQLARLHGATLALAGLVDYTPGEECEDYIPVMTPNRMRAAIAQDVSSKLQLLGDRIGAAGAEVIAAQGSRAAALADLVNSWQPDLVVVGAHTRLGLNGWGGQLPFDVLTLQAEHPTLGGRVVRALASAF